MSKSKKWLPKEVYFIRRALYELYTIGDSLDCVVEKFDEIYTDELDRLKNKIIQQEIKDQYDNWLYK